MVVGGLQRNNGSYFVVMDTNSAGCSYTSAAQDVNKW